MKISQALISCKAGAQDHKLSGEGLCLSRFSCNKHRVIPAQPSRPQTIKSLSPSSAPADNQTPSCCWDEGVSAGYKGAPQLPKHLPPHTETNSAQPPLSDPNLKSNPGFYPGAACQSTHQNASLIHPEGSARSRACGKEELFRSIWTWRSIPRQLKPA